MGDASTTSGTTPKDKIPTTQDDPSTSDIPQVLSKTQQEKEKKRKLKARVVVEHFDIIKETFWAERPWILEGKAPRAA